MLVLFQFNVVIQQAEINRWLLSSPAESGFVGFSSDIKNSTKEEWEDLLLFHTSSLNGRRARTAIIKYNVVRNPQRVSCWDF